MTTHTHIGETSHGKPVSLTRDERLRHMAIFGSTGVGKTTFLLNIVAQDIARGDGLLVIDPHGDFAERALSLVPPSRNNQVCYFNLTDSAYPVGFNVLEDPWPRSSRRASPTGSFPACAPSGSTCGARGSNKFFATRSRRSSKHRTRRSCFCRGFSPTRDFRARVVSRVTNPLTRAFFEQRNSTAGAITIARKRSTPVLNKIDAFLFSPAILQCHRPGEEHAAFRARHGETARRDRQSRARHHRRDALEPDGRASSCPRPGRGHGARFAAARGATRPSISSSTKCSSSAPR